MPQVQFKYPSQQIEKTARMFTPKHITRESAWYKEARKVIPLIPNIEKTDWQITNTIVSKGSVIFELHNSLGDRATVIIDRSVPKMG